ncbi:MAG: hypothetical protein V2I34_08745 [Bacteroidales bacterium]|jgi:uncharacterized lipoprotein YddW (UPF0748 family)|nr:hypothetical protein [Bacteroidales bacterium]
MKKLLILLAVAFALGGCQPKDKIPVYAWESGPRDKTDKEILDEFKDLKKKGIDGLMYNGGQDPAVYERVGAIAEDAGLEFHAWIPTMVQSKEGLLDTSLYAVNGLGQSAWTHPAFVPYYKFLCPEREEVYDFLEGMYAQVADLPQVDGIHLDYIRFPDVILARGLWDKYDLVMDREYPEFDYCYCDSCVAQFKEESGIDILAVEDPSQLEEWKQFRYDQITDIVNRLADMVHAKDKVITAAVFPGPNSVAKKIVRQEWDKWNLDAFYPMNYNDFYLEDTEWIGEVSKEGVEAINDRVPLYSGLFICPDPEGKAEEADPEGHGLVPSEIQDAIDESIENGAAGICLFTPSRMTGEGWKEFKKAIYR